MNGMPPLYNQRDKAPVNLASLIGAIKPKHL